MRDATGGKPIRQRHVVGTAGRFPIDRVIGDTMLTKASAITSEVRTDLVRRVQRAVFPAGLTQLSGVFRTLSWSYAPLLGLGFFFFFF